MPNVAVEALPADADPFTALPSYADVLAAAERIAPWIVRTPVLRSDELDEELGAAIYFKCENLQRGGAFKFRGACNAIAQLDPAARAHGVLTQSSGNHGAAIALACRLQGIAATVVVPAAAARIKRAAIARHGAEIVDCDTAQASRDAVTAEQLARTGASFVHPFNDARVIAGQGTAALELLQQQPDLDLLLAPVSGGGLLSGTALAAHGRNPAIEVFGAEPSGACDAHDSLLSHQRISGRRAETLCDGLRAELGPTTFALLQQHAAGVWLADDGATAAATRRLFEALKLVVEPSAAITWACLASQRERLRGRRIGVILSGGNLDLDRLPWQSNYS